MKAAKHLCLISGLICSFSAYAADGIKPFSTENEWNSPSIAGAGGIGALSDNVTDIFFSDPSLITQNKRKFSLQFFGLHAFFTKDASDTVQDVITLATKTTGSGNSMIVSAIDGLKKIYGRNIAAGVNINLLTFKIGNFSLVPYMSANLSAEAHVPAYPAIKASADAYGGLGIGYARSIGPQWDLGLSVRPGTRVYAQANVDSSQIGSDITGGSSSSPSASDIASTGIGIYMPVDIGVGFSPTKMLRFSLVMRDFAGASPLSTIGDTTPPTYPMRLNLGTTYTFFENGMHKVTAATEFQDLLNIASGPNAWLYRWQWGATYKFKLPSRLETTAGLNVGLQSGIPAASLFLDLFIFKVEAAMYAVETGAYPGLKPKERYAFRAYSQLAF